MRIILASGSPRRKEILEKAGFKLEISPTHIDEKDYEGESPKQYAMNLAESKCDAHPKSGKVPLVVTADTVVVHNNTVLNKPVNREEAIRMLQSLSGEAHEVITAVCVRSPLEKQVFYESTKVYFSQIPEDAIVHYVDGYQPFDKAGAYGIQEWIGYRYIHKLEGCYYNVMGFPMARFCEVLTEMRLE